MRRLSMILTLLVSTINVFGQQEVKFIVEELSKPEKLVHNQGYDVLYKKLILSDVNMSPIEVKRDSIDFPYAIIAKSDAPDSLVVFGYHSFFNGMYQAYADHRPFVLSPDMIWLLISQGFAQHVSANAEQLRKNFVDFNGRISLVVRKDSLALNSPASSWEAIFPEFTKQIAAHTGNDLIDVLTADFSTTTPVEKVASEITILEAMKPFFEFIVVRMVCGIPEITLKGTTEDWQKIYDKTKKIEHYDLKWWTDELEPILSEFIKTSKGEIDTHFWRNMFKYHSQEKYGAPKIIDGWIVKFFPYDKNGKRNSLKQLEGGGSLPNEIVKVDLAYIESYKDYTQTIPLELWAGFIGLEQNSTDFTLTPKIGWMIRKKDIDEVGLKHKFEKQSKNDHFGGGISIRVKEIPHALLEFKEIKNLEISFTDSVLIPDKLKEISIWKLSLSGKINASEIERIRTMFPLTQLIINNKKITTKPLPKVNDLFR